MVLLWVVLTSWGKVPFNKEVSSLKDALITSKVNCGLFVWKKISEQFCRLSLHGNWRDQVGQLISWSIVVTVLFCCPLKLTAFSYCFYGKHTERDQKCTLIIQCAWWMLWRKMHDERDPYKKITIVIPWGGYMSFQWVREIYNY